MIGNYGVNGSDNSMLTLGLMLRWRVSILRSLSRSNSLPKCQNEASHCWQTWIRMILEPFIFSSLTSIQKIYRFVITSFHCQYCQSLAPDCSIDESEECDSSLEETVSQYSIEPSPIVLDDARSFRESTILQAWPQSIP
jgi:hypothetical protein